MAGGQGTSRRFGTAGFNAAARHPHRHVWVGTTPSPGVLIEWRKDGADWLAHVVYVEAGRVVICWLPADMVRPFDA